MTWLLMQERCAASCLTDPSIGGLVNAEVYKVTDLLHINSDVGWLCACQVIPKENVDDVDLSVVAGFVYKR